MLNIYNLLLNGILVKDRGNCTLVFKNKLTKRNFIFFYNSVPGVSFIYTSGLFLKINNRLSTWFRYLNLISNTTNVRGNVNNDVLNNMLQSFFLVYITMFTSINRVESFRPLKLVPIIMFRFASFFFFNIIGNLFTKFKFIFGSVNFNSIYFFIKLNSIYNNSGIWGKKRKVKKAKVKLYGITSKGDSLYKDSSIFN